MKYALCVAESLALGPAYIMSHLRQQGHEVKLFFDPVFLSVGGTRETWLSRLFSVEEYNLKEMKKYQPDVCLFSCTTANYLWALRVAEKVKRTIGCRVVFGGIHPTSVPEVVMKVPFIDEVVVGEGVNWLGGTFDPDKLWPAREDFFRELPWKDRDNPYIMTSFGCPFDCSYCLPRGMKVRTPRRSVDGCIAELKHLKANGAKRISIWDDVFTSNKKWLLDFCLKYRTEVGLPFRCVTHCRFVDDEIAHALKLAGCHTIAIGIQTGSEKLRKEILNRKETNEEILFACKIIKDHDIILLVDHIFRIPFETDETNEESLQLYRQIAPDMVNVFELVYFPKAKIIDHAIRAGILTEEDKDKINHGLMPQYASGVNNIIANNDPYVKKILSVPLKGRLWRFMPEWLIKVVIYGRMYRKTHADCIPLTILQNHIFYIMRRLQKW